MINGLFLGYSKCTPFHSIGPIKGRIKEGARLTASYGVLQRLTAPYGDLYHIYFTLFPSLDPL